MNEKSKQKKDDVDDIYSRVFYAVNDDAVQKCFFIQIIFRKNYLHRCFCLFSPTKLPLNTSDLYGSRFLTVSSPPLLMHCNGVPSYSSSSSLRYIPFYYVVFFYMQCKEIFRGIPFECKKYVQCCHFFYL